MVFFIIFITSISLIDLSTCQPNLILYNNKIPATSTFNIRTSVNQPELQATWKYFLNTTNHYVCATGIWALYAKENYEHGDEAYHTALNTCGYFPPNSPLGSTRFVGLPGISRLNLYSNVNQSSNETVIYNNQPVLTARFRSLTLIGNTSIQLYLQKYYFGFSYCILADSTYPQKIDDISYFGLQKDYVKSLKFGCTSGAKVLELPMDRSRIPKQEKAILETKSEKNFF